MATVKKGILTRSPQWWKHLRDWKRVFWKRERQMSREEARRYVLDKHREALRDLARS